MTRLGDLERAVMDVLWDRSPGTADGVTVREVADALTDRDLAYTTVMTVLDRLAGKGMVQRERQGRAWSYRPAASRDAHIARLMLDALDLAGDSPAEPAGDGDRLGRGAALIRFARSVTGREAEILRAALTDEAAGLTGQADAVTDQADAVTGRAGTATGPGATATDRVADRRD
ncbi:BlaI/MecI/CopY family transcriptional regulator [Plantactinospora sp. GCM10030261]|uniref:BlaI/MecI/CopY family transcriptional regulator n=1 Tax=Plantactinospora sp. GCM10030261 TaxID=3273420 RepID=UPI00361D5EC7